MQPLREGLVNKGGHNESPTTPRPVTPPPGQGLGLPLEACMIDHAGFIFARDTIRRIDHLRPQNGDVLVIEWGHPLAQVQAEYLRRMVSDHLEAAGLGRVTVLPVGNLGEVHHLDERLMRAYGWVRAPE